MDNFLEQLQKETNYTYTENGAVTHKTTLDALYDLFAAGAAYRGRDHDDCALLFKKAYDLTPTYALKCLFYLRDIRGGQGERRFFRICFNWLACEHPEAASRNLTNIPEYGRWDDLYCLIGTPLEAAALDRMKKQVEEDLAVIEEGNDLGISLIGKWLKSENASSKETKRLANKTREAFGYSHKKYRKVLSALRTRINIVEKLMSENRWDEIHYDQLPSKAGLIYRNAFANRDGDRYQEFINDKETKVNADALYPYDIVRKVVFATDIEAQREVINKYWENQRDYLNGKPCKLMCVVDTSASMHMSNIRKVRPIDVAISLGIYCGERIGGPLKDHFISFSSFPQLIAIEGIDFCQKVAKIYNQDLCSNTDLKATFDLLLNMYLDKKIEKEDLPETLVIISDMEIDCGSYWYTEDSMKTDMERLRDQWAEVGLELPSLVYWNVDSRQNNFLDDPENPKVSYVSGCNPVLFQGIIEGKTGKELMIDKLSSERYEKVTAGE